MATSQKPISKSLTDSDKLLKLSWQSKCFYIFQKLHADNFATIKANSYFLKGEIYPKDDTVLPEMIDKMIQDCVNVGLLVFYEIDGINYIHDPQAGQHEKLVGNMSNRGEYPLPPENIVLQWKTKFNGVYTPVGRIKTAINSVYTPYKPVYTPYKPVNTPYKSVCSEDTDTDTDTNTNTDTKSTHRELSEEFVKLTKKKYITLLNAKKGMANWEVVFVKAKSSYPTTPYLEMAVQQLLIWMYQTKDMITNPVSILSKTINTAHQGIVHSLLSKEEFLSLLEPKKQEITKETWKYQTDEELLAEYQEEDK